MKKILVYLIIIFSFLVLPVYAKTFFPTVDMETEIYDGDTLYIQIGVKERDMQAVSGTISYDMNKLKLENVLGINGYEIDYGHERKEKIYKTFNFVADSVESSDNVRFMELTFKITDAFSIKDTADLFLYNLKVASSDLKKYRNNGKLMTLSREEKDLMVFNLEDLDSSIKRRYWFKEYKFLIIFIVLLIIGGVVAIFMIPSKRKKENRVEQMREQKKKVNYEKENIASFVSRVSDNVSKEEIKVDSPFEKSESKYIVEEKKTEDPLVDLKEDGICELEEDKLIQISESDIAKTKEDDKDFEVLPMIAIILISSFSFIGFVKAAYAEDTLFEIRERIIEEKSYNKEYDLNKDRKIDVADLVLERQFENPILDETNVGEEQPIIDDINE